MTLADAQQHRLLELLRKAGNQPIGFAELHADGISFPAIVVSELELNGYPTERVYDHGRLARGAPARFRTPRHTRRTPTRVAALIDRSVRDDKAGDRRSADQPDRAVAQLDRECLQRSSAGRRLHSARQRPERTLGAPHHRAGPDVIQRRVPRALQASIVGHATLPE